MRDAAAALALATLLLAATASADTDRLEDVQLPARVRVTLPGGERRTLDLLRIEGDVLHVRRPGRRPEPSTTLGLSSFETIERSRGHGRGKHAAIGAAVAAIAWFGSMSSCSGECAVGYVLVPVAGAAGGLIGALVAPERWTPLDTGRRQARLAFTLRF